MSIYLLASMLGKVPFLLTFGWRMARSLLIPTLSLALSTYHGGIYLAYGDLSDRGATRTLAREANAGDVG